MKSVKLAAGRACPPGWLTVLIVALQPPLLTAGGGVRISLNSQTHWIPDGTRIAGNTSPKPTMQMPPPGFQGGPGGSWIGDPTTAPGAEPSPPPLVTSPEAFATMGVPVLSADHDQLAAFPVSGQGPVPDPNPHPDFPTFDNWVRTRYNITDPVRIDQLWRYFLDTGPPRNPDPANPDSLPHRVSCATARYFWISRDINPNNGRPEWDRLAALTGPGGPASYVGTSVTLQNAVWFMNPPGDRYVGSVPPGTTLEIGARSARAGWFHARDPASGLEGWVNPYWLDFP